MQSFFWRGLISLCSYSFWRRSNFFTVEWLQFLIRAELFIFLFTVFPLCGLSCLRFLSRREHSTTLEGQRLGAVHIMEGTCSKLFFFFVRKEQNE